MVAFRQPDGGPPCLTVRFRVNCNRQNGKIRQRRIAKTGIMAPAPHPHFKDVRDFEPP